MSAEPLVRRGEAKRTRILDAAGHLFAEQGFDGTGIDEIAKKAGVNKAMLYYYIGDKATLYGAVITDFIQRLRAEVERRLTEIEDPREKIRVVQSTYFEMFCNEPHFPQLMQRELANRGGRLPVEALTSLTAVMGITQAIVEEGRRAGLFREVHPLIAHLLLVAGAMFLVNGQYLRARLEGEGLVPSHVPTDVRSLSGPLVDVILHGISASKCSGDSE